MSIRLGKKETYACPSCEKKAPKELKRVLARSRNSSSTSRVYERFEVPKDQRMKTKDLAKMLPKIPDSPVERDIVRNDAPKKRHKVICGAYGSGKMAEGRNEKVMRELRANLGPNPKVLRDDGLFVTGEAA